ncbi:hypothetical protein [Haloarchaeobius iranensis]|uniref:DUF8054 domain-containing protein n=1 Tax=Haloarchaeobius iranensis TaxID=996166 RepID=A0A1G9YG68_9EURY|nr:hypothetical protein [Haloarchaeobius iranensis]SDN07962.1 hypothetical protein SAMN05192554_11449 [Haloarchaeobius iranensis]
MRLPRGDLVRSRTATAPGDALAWALDADHTGYLVLEPADAVLGDGDDACVLTIADGVPRLAYHTGTERGGAPALADVAGAGPYSVDCYAVDRSALADVTDTDELTVSPGAPAERLAADSALAERTRVAAPDEWTAEPASPADPVEAFLADEERLDAIRDRAREEARRKAREWDLTDALVDGDEN